MELEKLSAKKYRLAADLDSDYGLYLARQGNALPATTSGRIANAAEGIAAARTATLTTDSTNIKVAAKSIEVGLVCDQSNAVAEPAQKLLIRASAHYVFCLVPDCV
jgi:hypothetical protein